MNPHRGKILVADDDPIIRAILQKLFEKSGFEVIAAQNGKEAVDLLSSEIRAVILDLEMPVMGGIECLRFIRKSWKTPVIGKKWLWFWCFSVLLPPDSFI